jgi:mRNA deadenylase 3'-5' endonuclease subunit Ccr4
MHELVDWVCMLWFPVCLQLITKRCLIPGSAATAQFHADAARNAQAVSHPALARHNVRFASASVAVTGKELQFTESNRNSGFCETIDYVFFTPQRLRAVACIGDYPWSKAIHPEIPALPNKFMPSDHLPLKAVFELLAPAAPHTLSDPSPLDQLPSYLKR